MRVLVCGGRRYGDDSRAERDGLRDRLERLNPSTVITGGATGADQHAYQWCVMTCTPRWTFPADWDQYGPSAGPIRNQRMLDEGNPDVVLAFPGGRGTADMVRRAKEAGIKVIEVEQ